MGKKILALIFSFLFVFLSCGCWLETGIWDERLYNEVVEVFSSFDDKTEIAKVYLEEYISFYDHKLNVDDLPVKGEEPKIIGVYNGEVYFQTVEHVGGKRFIYAYIGGSDNARVYKCDYYGENVAEVFIIEGFDSAPKFYCLDYTPGIIYIQRKEESSREYIIEAYKIETGEFETICKGVKYDDYIENLYGEKARKAEIRGKLTEEVAKELLMESEEGRAFLKYKSTDFYPRISFLNGRIFVSYSADAGLAWAFLDATFEYDEEKNELNYYCYNFIAEDSLIWVLDFYLY